MQITNSTLNTKPHYDLLDGLRGVAALAVLYYHLNEAIAFSAGAAEQEFFHGYLGVDFFFILSGFVMGYAYDDRWNKMSVGQFIKRRLIRLHPMVVLGVIIGVICFAIQGFCNWEGEVCATSTLLIATLMAMFLLPVPQSLDVRGNTEAFPLNGPHWSLFFEYIGSLLYALCIRKLSTRNLSIWVVLAGVLLLAVNLSDPSFGIAYGWSSEPSNLLKGSLRMLYGYPMGLLLARFYQKNTPSQLNNVPVFLLSAIALIALLSAPSFTTLHPQLKLYFELLCVVVCFPLIILTAARGTTSKHNASLIRYLGRLSYPLYAIHYPLIYLYIHWINTNQHPFGHAPWTTPIALAVIAIVVASIALLVYDEPLRKWLTKYYT